MSERSDDRPSDVRSVEVRVPHRMLRSGLCLLDTPGVGGLESVHGQLSLASLNGADGVLFVTDASQELTAPELGYLQHRAGALPAGRAGRDQDRPAPALATHRRDQPDAPRQRRDRHPRPRRSPRSCGSAPPVSPTSTRRAASPRWPSSWPACSSRRCASRRAAVAHEVDFVAAQLAHENDAERVVLARARGARLRSSRSSTRCTSGPGRCRASSAAWQQVLADGIQDLVADVEHDLAARLRTVLRDARDIIDESDPKDTWEDTQAWLRRQVAEAGVANRDLLLRSRQRAQRRGRRAVQPRVRQRCRAGAGLGDPRAGRARAAVGVDVRDARGTPGLGSVQRPAGGVRPAHGVERRAAHDAADHPARRAARRGGGPQAVPDGGQAAEGLPAGPGQGRGGQVRRRGRVRDEQGHP